MTRPLMEVPPQERGASQTSSNREAAAQRIAEIQRLRASPGSARVPGNLTDAIRAIVDPAGGVELDLPERSAYREPPRFDWFDPEP